ncbi:MAG: diguanylate cyclase [Candidatus Kaelpia imicola]|nr:diguanylate cyclase [Candidatus Kaelpia imicola]
MKVKTKIHFPNVVKTLQNRIHDLHILHSQQKEMEDNLRYSERQYRMTLDSMSDAIHVVNSELRILLINKTFKRWIKVLGLDSDVIGKSIFDTFPFLKKNVFKEYEDVFKTGRTMTTVEKNRVRSWYIITQTKKIPVIENDHVVRVVTVIRDITEPKRIKEELIKSEREKSLILNSICEHVIYHDLYGKMVWVNKAAADSVNKKQEELVGKNCYSVWHNRETPCVGCPVVRAKKTGLSQESEIISPDGRIWLVKGCPLKNLKGETIGIVETTLEITKRKNAEESLNRLNKVLLKSHERMKKLIVKDSLTGLYNNKYLNEIVESEFSRARRSYHPFSLILFDIDYFKSINDVYGYNFGDSVLKQFARQLKRMVRRYDIVVRSGGEEFIVLCPGTDNVTSLKLARRMLDEFNIKEFGNNKQRIKFSLSIAVVGYPSDKMVKLSGVGKIVLEGKDLINIGYKILSKVKEVGGNRAYSSEDIRFDKRVESEAVAEDANINFLKGKLEHLTKEANRNLIESVFAFAKTIDLKDHYTGEHVEQTVKFAITIAKELSLPKDEVEKVREAAILHDLGKIGISEDILHKRKRLTKREYEIIKRHPQIGVDIIRPIHALHDLIPYILYHHERWNGQGYPHGLKGEEIPFGARIVAVADVYQALISDRPYRAAYSKEEAVRIIKESAGSEFDPEIVDVFIKVLR